jgi:tetratricopeptide (TPR) repeat protein
MTHSARAWTLFVLGLILYGNSLSFGFVLDDKIVITHNEFTKKGLDGIGDIFSNDSMTGFFGQDKKLVAGGRYRPLSMMTHAIEWEFFGGKPMIYHLVNVLMYGLTGFLLYHFLSRLLRDVTDESAPWYLQLPFLASLLWVVHPLHTEAVANIKGRDEVMSVLGGIAAMHYALRWWDERKSKDFVLALFIFFLSLLSKESSIVVLGILPLALLFFRKATIKSMLLPVGGLLGMAILYVGIRYAVLGSAKLQASNELMNNPFIHAEGVEKVATLFYTYLLYFKLLVFPHPLTHDYYPKHIPIVDFGDPVVLLSVLMHLGLVYLLFRSWKRNPILAFGIALYFVAFSLYSNIVFNIGTFMNERFMYLPSLGFVLILGHYLLKLSKQRAALTALLAIVFLASSWKTIDRNFAWESDLSLSTTDVLTSDGSAKAHMGAGSAILEAAQKERNEAKKRAMLQEAIDHFTRSLQIHPSYFPPMILTGNALAAAEEWEASLPYYENCLKLKPKDKDGLNNLEYVGQQTAQKKLFSTSIKAYRILIQHSPQLRFFNALGELYGKELGDLSASIEVVEQGLQRYPTDADLLQKLGVARAMQGQTQEAMNLFKKALKEKPNNARLYLNMGIAYQNLGRQDSANFYIQKALEIEPELRFN